jgi:RHS repeat-associated protein
MGNVIQETDGQGNLLASYIYANGQRICRVTPDGEVVYYHNDVLGSPVLLMNQDGEVVHLYHFGPFGNIEAAKGTSGNKYRFTGKEQDETGMYYFGARYYEPLVGRFITSDPVTGIAPRSLNPYYYCYANPTTYVDPTGQWVWVVPLALGLYGAYMGYRARGWGGALIGFNMGAIGGGILVIGAEWAPIAGGNIWATLGNAAIGTMFIDVSTQLLTSNEVNWEQAWAAGLSGAVSALAGHYIKKGFYRWIYDPAKLERLFGGFDKAIRAFYTLLAVTGATVLLSTGYGLYRYYIKGEKFGNPWHKITNIFNLDEWVTGKEGGGGGMIGWLDIKHVLLGALYGGIFKAAGINRNVAIVATMISAFLIFESVGEASVPWEYGDFFSDFYGVIGAYGP